MWVKMEKFINKLKHIKSYIKTTHQRLVQLDLDGVRENKFSRNPYQVFFDWFLFEIVQYGLLLSLVYFWYICDGYERFILLPFALGVARWVLLDTIRKVRQAINGE